MTIERQSDDFIWNALKQGDKLAFAELYQRYYSPLYSYGFKLLPEVGSVEDAIQDLFIELWRLRQNLSTADSVKFYLFRSLRRQLYRMSEKEKRADTVSSWAFADTTFHSAEQLLVEQEQEEQLAQRLTQLLQDLPQRQLEVVTLRFYENFKTREIAAIMGITEKSVRNTLHKALSHLREQIHYLAPLLGLLLVGLLALA
ncbi:sigma-70 family RNA polymerase sigma factor [Spirosoma sp. KCTC 42546]|uniref:RNA polymerase sigma factor n=1 Tax=Spirosoma sp. KCTC 42546 TaxID=2520506 RepID=UPI00115B4589|nr:sigma-70 family RNA polymerase sigma factor [Spirosoma sp. KCTC 42546]QDK83204.1 sigma-70 family RNA polymerase sigma factor [Spirosoma sp. KCTC 42546]